MRARAVSRPTPGKMNKLEARFAGWLRSHQLAGNIESWAFEPIRLKIGADQKTTYLPDFFVTDPEGRMTFYEVKGFWRDDARVKIKVAAAMFPQFGFVAATEARENEWKFEEIPPGSAESAPHNAWKRHGSK